MQKNKFRIDEIVLVFIVAVLAMIVSIYDKSNNYGASIEAEKINQIILGSHRLSFASNNVINEEKLNEIKLSSYKELKTALDVKNDFCIYIEDESGNLILAKGSPKVINDGIHCVE